MLDAFRLTRIALHITSRTYPTSVLVSVTRHPSVACIITLVRNLLYSRITLTWEFVSARTVPNVTSIFIYSCHNPAYCLSSGSGSSCTFCKRDRNLVRGGSCRLLPISLLERGVSDGTYVGSTRWSLGGSRGEDPGTGVSKLWPRPLIGLPCGDCGCATWGAYGVMGPGGEDFWFFFL